MSWFFGDIHRCVFIVVDAKTVPQYESYVEYYLKYTNKSEQERELARDTLRDGNWFGTTMVKLGDADGLVSGIRQSTFDTVTLKLELLLRESKKEEEREGERERVSGH